MNHSSLQLKVCEACGALWLRAGVSVTGQTQHSNVYCKPCVRMFADFPAPRGPKKASRIRVRVRTRVQPRVEPGNSAAQQLAQAGAR